MLHFDYMLQIVINRDIYLIIYEFSFVIKDLNNIIDNNFKIKD